MKGRHLSTVSGGGRAQYILLYYIHHIGCAALSVAPHGSLQFCHKLLHITSVKVRWDAMTTLPVARRCEHPVQELRVVNALDTLILEHVLKSTVTQLVFKANNCICWSWNQKPVRNYIWTTACLNSRPRTVQTFSSQESAVSSNNASLSW